MADDVVRSESPLEFFKHQVEGAMQRQRVHASEWTVYYLVNLLASFVPRQAANRAADVDVALGVRLAKALSAEGGPSRDDLRRVADDALFLAGFFGDSLERRLVDRDYFITLGGYAYARLARRDEDAFADVFGELAEKFVPVVDVLSDISDRTHPGNRHLLRVYERWLRTGSGRDRNLLTDLGLSAALSRRVQ